MVKFGWNRIRDEFELVKTAKGCKGNKKGDSLEPLAD